MAALRLIIQRLRFKKDKTGIIKVTYNAENPGKFTKRVTVKFANIATPLVLTIDGEVVEKSLIVI